MKLKYLPLLLVLTLPVTLTRAADPASAPDTEAHDFTGTVVETMNTGNYTYVQVDTGKQKFWAATTQFAVKKGATVTVVGGMPMANYHSQSLNRDFDLVYFTGRINVAGAAADAVPALPPGHPTLTGADATVLPPGHPSLTGAPDAAKTDVTGIQRAVGGQTIQEIFAGKQTFAGKSVAVRGRVVKYNSKVMGKNWVHLRDGTGSAATKDNDLTVTTDTAAKVGDTVLVTGKLTLNKDFGSGYKYSVILEDAQVTVE